MNNEYGIRVQSLPLAYESFHLKYTNVRWNGYFLNLRKREAQSHRHLIAVLQNVRNFVVSAGFILFSANKSDNLFMFKTKQFQHI